MTERAGQAETATTADDPVVPADPAAAEIAESAVAPGESDDPPRKRPLSEQSLLEQMGGVRGMIYSAIPVVVFVLANSLFSLKVAIWSSLAVAIAILASRIIARETVQPAVSGFLGVAIAGFIAAKTGDAKDYFLFGIYMSLVYGGVFVASILVRWPVAGVVWHLLNGTGHGWRKDKVSLRAYDIATIAMASVFAARFVVQQWLHAEDLVGWLAFAKISMGLPLWGLALLVFVWAVRRSEKHLKEITPVPESDEDIERQLREKYGAGNYRLEQEEA